MIVEDRSVEREDVESFVDVDVLEIGREDELEESVEVDSYSVEVELGDLLWDWELEDVSFFVSFSSGVTTMQLVLYQRLPKASAETVNVFFLLEGLTIREMNERRLADCFIHLCCFGITLSDEFLPFLDRIFSLMTEQQHNAVA